MDGKGSVARTRGVGRGAIAALLISLLILDIVLIGVATDAFNRMINIAPKPTGNAITSTVLLFALIDGGFLGAGIVLGFSHIYLYNAGSVGPAFVGSVFAWGINLLTLGFVCKEINIGHQGPQERAIDILVIVISFFSSLYMLIFFGAVHHPKLGIGYGSNAV